MTTTLRPSGAERRDVAGGWARGYAVCVNGRTVGGVELAVDPRHGEPVGRIAGLVVQPEDRRRGRGTVAVLAAEEVLRHRGCTRVEISVPADAAHAARIAAALGYAELNRSMIKDLDPAAPPGSRRPLPAGSVLRPLSEAEYQRWRVDERADYLAQLEARGVPGEQAVSYEAAAFAAALPDGPATAGTALLRLEHEGTGVGHLWLRVAEPAYVFSVAVDAAHRGRGHGRTLMLAAERAAEDAGCATIGLSVFADNSPALKLYGALGYRTTGTRFAKPLT